jgi:hypothetical protein
MIIFDGVDNLKDAELLGKVSAAIVNTHFIEPMELLYEKTFEWMLLAARKRYAAKQWGDGKQGARVQRGIESVRRDNCVLVKEMIDRVLDMVFLEHNVPAAVAYARGEIEDLMRGRTDPSRLVISKLMGRDYKTDKLVHVQLAKRIAERDPGSAPKMGDRVHFVMVRGTRGTKQYMLGENPLYAIRNNIDPDTDYYLENQLRKPLTRLFRHMIGRDETEELFTGQHTRFVKRSLPDPSLGGLVAMISRMEGGGRCYGCGICTQLLQEEDAQLRHEQEEREREERRRIHRERKKCDDDSDRLMRRAERDEHRARKKQRLEEKETFKAERQQWTGGFCAPCTRDGRAGRKCREIHLRFLDLQSRYVHNRKHCRECRGHDIEEMCGSEGCPILYRRAHVVREWERAQHLLHSVPVQQFMLPHSVLRYLTASDLHRASQVCHEWRNMLRPLVQTKEEHEERLKQLERDLETRRTDLDDIRNRCRRWYELTVALDKAEPMYEFGCHPPQCSEHPTYCGPTLNITKLNDEIKDLKKNRDALMIGTGKNFGLLRVWALEERIFLYHMFCHVAQLTAEQSILADNVEAVRKGFIRPRIQFCEHTISAPVTHKRAAPPSKAQPNRKRRAKQTVTAASQGMRSILDFMRPSVTDTHYQTQ